MCIAVICQPQISYSLSSQEMHIFSWILWFTYLGSVASSLSFCYKGHSAPTIRSTSIKRKVFLPAEPNTRCPLALFPGPRESWLLHNFSHVSTEHLIVGTEQNSSRLICPPVAGSQPMWMSHQYHLWTLSYLQHTPTILSMTSSCTCVLLKTQWELSGASSVSSRCTDSREPLRI